MNPNLIEAREYVVNAREALRRGDKNSARDLGEKAVLLVPDLEDAWLILVAADSNPEDALAYAQKALELNPESPRARKAVDWATRQLDQVRAGHLSVMAEPVRYERSEAAVAPPIPLKKAESKTPARVEKRSNRRAWLYAGAVLGLLLCAALVAAGWWAFSNPAIASLFALNEPAVTHEPLWAQAEVAKPEPAPLDVNSFAVQAEASTSTPIIVTEVPTTASTEIPTLAPTETFVPTEEPTMIPEVTETPGVMGMEIVVDTPTSAYVASQPDSPALAMGNGVRWIDVDLSTQSLYAYEGDTVVNSFVVSTGTWRTPTVTGRYKIWIKLKSTTMSGPGYYLTNVPYTMYFYKGYGIHGTYWHNNFGTPMSHGCVNMRTSDAEWLFYWASEGTVVNVHY